MEKPITDQPAPARKLSTARRIWRILNSRSEKTYKRSILMLRSLHVLLAVVALTLLVVVCVQRGEQSNGLIYLGSICFFTLNFIEISALRRSNYSVTSKRLLSLIFCDLAVAGLLIPGSLMEMAHYDYAEWFTKPRPPPNPLKFPKNLLIAEYASLQVSMIIYGVFGFFLKEDTPLEEELEGNRAC